MKCQVCEKEADKLDYSKLTIKNITKVKVMDTKIKDKATVLNLTLCRSCSDKLQAAILTGTLPDSEVTCDPECDHKCSACDLIR